MQITRYASLSEPQFLGCVSAFADSLTGELNSAAMYLRKLEGQTKGAAFAYEMSLDRHRYGALTVLDRWGTFVAAFGPHVTLRYPGIVTEARSRVGAAEGILENANRLIDGAGGYSSDVVEACVLAFQSLASTFAEERHAADQSALLGPMLPEEFKQARGIFLHDLAAR
ncbi:MAG TPA: hypothetical protein VN924_26780 [Bryobacteraceae bacterium]|nr:hypothetical protein [Bryobacteraceae bacterium]